MRSLAVVALLLAAAGCVQVGEHTIDQARNGSATSTPASDQPQESVSGTPTTGDASGNDIIVGGSTVTDGGSVGANATPPPPSGPTPLTPPSPATAPTPPPAGAPTPPPPSPTPAPSTPTPSSSTPPPPTPPPPTAPPPSPTPAPTTPPSPAPAPQPAPQPAWPHEGSYVKWTGEWHDGCPVGCYSHDVYANASWTFHNGDWSGTCVEESHEWWQYNDSYYNSSTTRTFSAAHPPHWPLFDPTMPPAVGSNITVWTLQGCRIESDQMVYRGTADVAPWGHVYRATDTDEATSNYSDFTSYWSPRTGLVWTFGWAHMEAYSAGGRIVSTDAPS